MNTFNSQSTLKLESEFDYFSLEQAEKAGAGPISRLPFSLKIMLENLLRYEDGVTVTADDIRAMAAGAARSSAKEIAFRPARVLMQDFTGVPAIVDLATMRDVIKEMGGDPKKINPLQQVDLVIDHSVQVDQFGTPAAFAFNADRELERNRERYVFLKWGQKAFQNCRVVPPDVGIVHQVNLEYIAKTVYIDQRNARTIAYPDTLVGTDSHTTMINGLGVVGWGVGGIEAEGAMLGQPLSMLIPLVVGFKLRGQLPEGATATDVVLTVTQMLRAKGVVGKFVEFYGPGLASLSLADRATIANMAPEYGAAGVYFAVDDATLDYLRLTGRIKELINRGGEKIAPREVDDVLLTHPAVSEAVCFGIAHPTWGEEVAAAVVLREPATEADLLAYCRERLADFKRPKKLYLVDTIPRTATGKVQRLNVAAALAGKRG